MKQLEAPAKGKSEAESEKVACPASPSRLATGQQSEPLAFDLCFLSILHISSTAYSPVSSYTIYLCAYLIKSVSPM